MKHSKHVFTTLIVVILCVVALFLSGVVKGVKKDGLMSIVQKSDDKGGVPYISTDSSYRLTTPADFTSSALSQDDGSETAIFVGSTATRNFQIYSSDYASDAPLTPQEIAKNIPDLLIEKPETIAVDGAQGVAFISGPKDGTLRTREIWFAHGGKLYQITTFKEFDDQMVDILSTWKWQ